MNKKVIISFLSIGLIASLFYLNNSQNTASIDNEKTVLRAGPNNKTARKIASVKSSQQVARSKQASKNRIKRKKRNPIDFSNYQLLAKREFPLNEKGQIKKEFLYKNPKNERVFKSKEIWKSKTPGTSPQKVHFFQYAADHLLVRLKKGGDRENLISTLKKEGYSIEGDDSAKTLKVIVEGRDIDSVSKSLRRLKTLLQADAIVFPNAFLNL